MEETKEELKEMIEILEIQIKELKEDLEYYKSKYQEVITR